MTNLEPDTITAIAAASIALIALIVSVWQGIIMRRHNSLSVNPRLRFDWVNAFNEPTALYLVNTGLGPAIIECLSVAVSGTEPDGNYDAQMSVFNKLINGRFRVKYYTPYSEEAMSPGERLLLVGFAGVDDEESIRYMDEVIHNAVFRVRYKSAYGERFTSSSSL